MTFINARILRKRPNLFVTPKRNYGNLLIKYESGTDGTAPDPDPPAPDPVTFTTSWTTNAGVVTANLTGISSHRTTEVIVLTRDDGTVLATLDENKVGNWDLQHDEGTTYGSYTYNVRLDGVIKSTFSRTYEPDTPSFTTNFFSNTTKVISCAIDTITNPHDSYSVRLARPDNTILDTQVLNDASAFFLQFTESDYGTYDYKLLLSKWTTTSTSNPNIPPESYWVDTVIATHQHIFVRPEPTFTTSWTKSGLSITVDLSGIVGGHPEFYAYLCRDDGTTLATHQFQTGQTTTSLSFTEADYGSYNYQLKLGTVVKSSHTETYVRPTPTYTASFSTNELTLTASITSITNAHSSFAITLERDDGTVLQTHTLAENETSFNFTQTETSYATFNYVVKLNGTQTDTYSATYTPPPTPTFDIALTNDDLAITATLTNIVNPDPYYTLMIHDANDTHLDGHTFATGDTTVTLTWTETSYGEKTYTKLLNGASIGTETITLTDPNATTPTFNPPDEIPFIYANVESWFDTGRKYVRNQTTSTSAQYFLTESNGTEVNSDDYDIKLTYTNGQLSLNIEPTDGQNVPEYWRINNSGSFFINGNLSVGDDIWCYKGNQTTVKCRFTVPDFFSSSTPPSTLKWNFSDKHDGTAEGFSVHDDQTPPCYVEKASDGTWSLTLTGVLANRQDQSPGNNWDYIETTGGTVYLKYKNWDSGGYWSGPYTRAEWSSSIGSETIRIYEHSSYSEQYNNGIYLIQESSSFTNFPSTIAFTGWWKDQFNRHYQLTTSTDTFIQYELYDANGLVGAEYGSTFTSTPSGILFNVEDVGDSSTPFSYSNGSTFVGTSGIVQAGDSLTLWTNATGTGTAEAVFTVPDFFYEPPTLVSSINITNGKAFNNENYTSYIHRSTDTTNSRYIYALGNTSTSTAKDIAYEWMSQKWVDIDTNATHNTFGNSVSDTANTSRETSANPQTVYVMETYWNLLYAVFTNPYYEA